jgi:hypothetical protein
VGNRSVSVLVSAVTEVVFSVETVQSDPRHAGDDQMPFGPSCTRPSRWWQASDGRVASEG